MDPQILISSVIFRYDTTQLPPPFCYRYTLHLRFDPDEVKTNYNHHYYGREELEEEEILEEGFSHNDDFTWKGNLPGIWKSVLLDKIEKSNYRKKKKNSEHEPQLEISLNYADGNEEVKHPDDLRSWEFLLQEVVQAIFELGKKEMPLKISYLFKNEDLQILKVFEMTFAERKSTLTEEVGGKRKYPKVLSWDVALRMLRNIYALDYDAEKSLKGEMPSRQGRFIDPGEGIWYKLGEGVTNPEPGINILEKVKEAFDA
ncbi:MAG: hypothetical protein JJU28_10875 [Cyclobacteriaceae bacterium]|nr:hypothetical protein [Cyclobacteriaceae bacterium]